MENMPPLPTIEFTDELMDYFGIQPIKSKKEMNKFMKEVREKSQKLIEKRDYCPISSKLSQMELILHNIINELSRIADIEGKDRTLHDVKFHNLASCRYSIEDAQSAIDEYKLSHFGKHSYLSYYGLLQAFQSQQDSLKNLFQLIFNKSVRDGLRIYPEFEKIRTIRNKILHSTENTREVKEIGIKYIKNYAIIQVSMRKEGFDLIEITKEVNKHTGDEYINDSKSEEVDLYFLIELQEQKVLSELNSYLKILKKSKSFLNLESLCPFEL